VFAQKVISVLNTVNTDCGHNSRVPFQVWRNSRSMTSMYLYLTHESKDAIEKKKHKYNKQDITLINNFDIDRYISLDVEDKDDMLNTVCDLIDEYGLANIRELKRFVRDHGDKYGLPSMKIINSVLRAHTALVRLYFDAVYQERKYGRSDVNQETGEITKK